MKAIWVNAFVYYRLVMRIKRQYLKFPRYNKQKEMGIPDHLTCLLKKLYAGQVATVRTRHGKQTGSKFGKEYVKAVCCHPAYLTYMWSTS